MQANDTALRNLVIFGVYVRCHTFRALEADLDRNKALPHYALPL